MTETLQKVFTSKELFDHLVTSYFNTSTKVKKIDAENFIFLFGKFKDSENPLIIRSDGLSILFEGRILFLLDQTNAVQHNAHSVIRDLLNILYDGEKRFHRKDIEEKFIFQ